MLIRTERLLLREWEERDLHPLAAMNADAQVMEFYPATLRKEESDAGVERYRAARARDGFGFLAAERSDTGELIGILGMQTMGYAIDGVPQPAVEIGWRLAKAHWGNGFATEGARAVMEHGFDVFGLERIVAVTAAVNGRSRRVMEKLGMRHWAGKEFMHAGLPGGSWLNPHVVYEVGSGGSAMSEREQLRHDSAVPGRDIAHFADMPTNSSEGTNRFECPHCGRLFNSNGEFRQHETECGAAKLAGGSAVQAKTDKEKDPDREWTSTP